MADRSITVNVKAVVSDFERGMSRAEQKTREFDRSVSGLIKNNRREMQTLGIAGAAMGAAVAGGFVASAKAAMSWESAFAGVVKTVDATAAELAVLEKGLRDMALEIPATHEELAGIAEAAGQLGVEVPNILGFTRVMADLSVATNLTAEEAAILFARFGAITQLDQTQFSNLGSAVVALGNNFATTEREIGEMALRLAGAGHQVGLSQADILGFAAALSHVGVEAQAGGTAISRVMIEIDKSVRTGGQRLETFARVAGMTADQFKQAYGSDAAGAIVTFIEGLRKVSEEGGNVFGVLEDLSLQDIRVRDALLRAANAGDVFRESIERSSTAFKENTALTEEANRRYQTVESQMQLAVNAIKDMAISFGNILLPVIVPVLEVIRDLAGWFSNLPEPIKIVVGVAAGLAGVFAGIAGAALILGPRIFDLVKAWQALRTAMLAAKAAEFVPTIPGGGIGGTVGGVVGRALPVVGAGIALKVLIDESAKLGRDMATGQRTLAVQLADLMKAAEQGDRKAKQRVEEFKKEWVDSRGFWTDVGDRLNFMGNRHQAQEIWKQAEALAGVGRSVDTVTDAARRGARSWATYESRFADAGRRQSQFSESFRAGAKNVHRFSEAIHLARYRQLGYTMTQRASREEAQKFIREFHEQRRAADSNADSMNGLTRNMRRFLEVNTADPIIRTTTSMRELNQESHRFIEANDIAATQFAELGDHAVWASVGMQRFLEVNNPVLTGLGLMADGAGAAATEFRNAVFQVDEVTDQLWALEAAQRAVNTAFEGTTAVGKAVEAVKRLRRAQEELNEVQKNKKATDEEVATAQWNYVEALLSTQGAIDSLSFNELNGALDIIAEALGMTRTEAVELLNTLGVMDGYRVSMYIDVFETIKKNTPKSAVRGPSFTPEIREAGGPVSPGSLYQVGEKNKPELLAGPNGMYLIPGDAGRMFSNSDVKALVSAFGGGGKVVNQNITLQGTGSPHSDAQLVGATASVLRMVEGG